MSSKNEIEHLKISLKKSAEDQAAVLLANHKRSLEEMRREVRAQIVRETGLKIIESLESQVRSGLTPQDRAQMNVQFRTTLESMKPDGAKVGANQ
jgi:hypothetical protein